jgi:hypothetical protein
MCRKNTEKQASAVSIQASEQMLSEDHRRGEQPAFRKGQRKFRSMRVG